MLYSFIERELERIIFNVFYDQYNFKNNFDNKKYNNKSKLQKLGIYLFDECPSFKFPYNDSWDKLTTIYNSLRNNIVHNDGKMPVLPAEKMRKNDKILLDYIKNNPSLITIGRLERFNLSELFLFEVINTIETFFNEFFHAWRDFMETT